VPESSEKRLLQLSNALDVLYPASILASKLAVLAQIGRSSIQREKTAIFLTGCALAAFNTMSYAGIFLTQLVACTPRSKISDPTTSEKCISETETAIATSSIDLASNIMLLLLLSLAMRKLDDFIMGRRLAAAGVLSLAVIVCATSVFRLYFSIDLGHTLNKSEARLQMVIWA
jgi:hypothetical protein